MKRALIVGVAVLLGGSWLAAGEAATRDECVTKVQEMVKLIQDKGLEEAIKQGNLKDGGFAWKDTYVYVMDLDAKILSHPVNPKLVGKNLMGLKAPKTGQLIFPEVFAKIKADPNAKGWFDYMWATGDSGQVKKKVCYYERHGDVCVFAGIYED